MRYVVADQASMTITGGPYEWDGIGEWMPPASPGSLMLEADALTAGYAYPADGQ